MMAEPSARPSMRSLLRAPGDAEALNDLALCSAKLEEIASKIPVKELTSTFRFHRAWIRSRYGGDTAGAEELIPDARRDPETDPHEILRLQAALRAAQGDSATASVFAGEAERTLAHRRNLSGFDATGLEGIRLLRRELEAA